MLRPLNDDACAKDCATTGARNIWPRAARKPRTMNDTASIQPPTSAYTSSRTIKTTRLACVHCQREIRASDVEMIGSGLRLVCGGCHRDLIMIEKQ